MASLGPRAAIAGFDCRIDEDGTSHPWRMIAWRPTGAGEVVVRHVGPLPDGRLWLSVPRDALYGDLQTLDGLPLEDREEEIARELRGAGIDELLVGDRDCAISLFAGLRLNGVVVRELDGYVEKMQEMRGIEDRTPHREFPGQAGTEIATIRIMTGATE